MKWWKSAAAYPVESAAALVAAKKTSVPWDRSLGTDVVVLVHEAQF